METEQIVRRPFLGREVRQRHKSEFICLNDVIKAGNQYRIARGMGPVDLQKWLQHKSTKELIAQVESQYGKVKMAGRGRSAGTWAHPIIAMDLALHLHPKLKVSVYEWILDSLLENRDKSGDSYKFMCGALHEIYPNKVKFHLWIPKVAAAIKHECETIDWNGASNDELEYRTAIHNSIAVIATVVNDPNQAVATGIMQARKQRQHRLEQKVKKLKKK